MQVTLPFPLESFHHDSFSVIPGTLSIAASPAQWSLVPRKAPPVISEVGVCLSLAAICLHAWRQTSSPPGCGSSHAGQSLRMLTSGGGNFCSPWGSHLSHSPYRSFKELWMGREKTQVLPVIQISSTFTV